ncbi:MAG: hypothetical protein ACE5NA_08700 [Nitrospiraceae bacterium]
MPTDHPSRRERTLERLLGRADHLLERGKRVSSTFSRWRLAIFLAGVACSVIPFKLGWYNLGNAALMAFVLIFIIVARYHSRLEDRMHRLQLWRRMKQVHLARLRLSWTDIAPRQTTVPPTHPYATDLDITGTYSLVRLLDTTVSSNGRERLASWLLEQPPSTETWQSRQSLIKELAGLPLFRDRLTLEASLIDERELDGDRLRVSLQTPVGFPGLVPILGIQASLAATTLILVFLYLILDIPGFWILSFTIYAGLYILSLGKTAPVFQQALSQHRELERLGAMFRYLERRSYGNAPSLGRLCSPLVQGDRRPSDYIRRLARVFQALSIRAHPLVYLLVNALCPWDFFYTYRLERLRSQVLTEVPDWFNVLGTLEAASALGTFGYLHPEYVWPSPIHATESIRDNGQPASIVAQSLGHPMIPATQRVTNDIELKGLGRILIITGSNMSGKSTFLRTLGINTCLAQAGAPVCAASFQWTWVRLYSCIRVDDSLEAGLSFFYAEVKRLKRLLDAAQDRSVPPVLFLIDEIFKGTNNRERLVGSSMFVKALAGSNGFGLITTHDLELAEMEREVSSAANAHFQEDVKANELTFDYKLRPGPCPTTNALRIMAIEGLPVRNPST